MTELGKIIDEFTAAIPQHIDDLPEISSNGVTRAEMELKYIVRAMAAEIINLRNTRASGWISVDTPPEKSGAYLAKGVLEGEYTVIEATFKKGLTDNWTAAVPQLYDQTWAEIKIHVDVWMPLPK